MAIWAGNKPIHSHGCGTSGKQLPDLPGLANSQYKISAVLQLAPLQKAGKKLWVRPRASDLGVLEWEYFMVYRTDCIGYRMFIGSSMWVTWNQSQFHVCRPLG